ncbi:MAG: hypothetical protein PVH30_02980 [Desulfobacterales bacterium]
MLPLRGLLITPKRQERQVGKVSTLISEVSSLRGDVDKPDTAALPPLS